MNSGSESTGSGNDQDLDGLTRTAQFAASQLSVGDTIGDRYRIEKLIGVGGMGMVYLAHDIQLDIPVALKILRAELATKPDSVRRFRQELLLSRQVSSPHVVRIHDLVKLGTHWVISMDYVDGQGLDQYIDQHGQIPVEETVSILRQLAEGLAAAHARDVIHRDLKPSNVLIDGNGRVCITDFGVARSLGSDGMTRTGTIIGTPEYLSPEQARAETADARSDLYSLGLILYEMLSGKLPFSEGTPTEMLAQKMSRQPPALEQLPADLPQWVRALCARLLQAYPARRCQSAREVVAAIDNRNVPRRRARLVAVALIGFCALALAVAGGYWWFEQQRTQAPQAPAALQPDPARLAVMPFVVPASANSDASIAPLLKALSMHLDAWLRSSTATGVVTPERVHEAMAEAHLQPGSAPPQPEAILKALASRALVVPQLQAHGDGYRIVLTLYRKNQDSTHTQADADNLSQLVPAYKRAAQDLLKAMHLTISPPALPDKQAQLAALAGGHEQDGERIDALRALHEAQPRAAWPALQLAKALHQSGKDDQAIEMMTTMPDAGNPGDNRIKLELAAFLAQLRGNNEALLAIRRKLAKLFPHDPRAQLELAESEGNAGHLDRAIKRLAALNDQDPGNPRVWYLRGKFAILKGDAQRAVDDFLVRALVQFNRSRDTRGQAETINALGVGYGRLGQTDAARTEYAKALELRRSLGDQSGEASSLRNLAALDWVQGDFDAAEERLHKAQSLLEKLDDRQGLADLHNDLGLLAEERGNYAESLKEFRRGLALRQQLNDARGSAESLNNIGFSYYQQGQYDNAQVYWQQSSQAFSRGDNQTGLVRSAQSLALLDIALGNWDQAEHKLKQALKTAHSQQMREEQAVSLSYLAKLDILQGRLADAGSQLAAADKIFHELDDMRGLAEIALQRARLQVNLLDYTQASSILKTLQPDVKDLGIEQRLALDLENVRLARLQRQTSAPLLRKTTRAVQRTGLHALQIEASLENAHGKAADLKTIVAGMTSNSTPLDLRLRGLEYLLQAQTRSGQYEPATESYSRARSILAEHKKYVRAWHLHALGFHALTARGDTAGAKQARQRAEQAMNRLLSNVSEDARQRLRQAFAGALSSAAAKP